MRSRAQAGPQERHQQSRRHTLAGDVGDHDADLILKDADPVVVVTRDFFGRKVVGADLESRQDGVARRQQFQLYLTRHFQLPLESLLFHQLFVQHHLLDDDRHLRG